MCHNNISNNHLMNGHAAISKVRIVPTKSRGWWYPCADIFFSCSMMVSESHSKHLYSTKLSRRGTIHTEHTRNMTNNIPSKQNTSMHMQENHTTLMLTSFPTSSRCPAPSARPPPRPSADSYRAQTKRVNLQNGNAVSVGKLAQKNTTNLFDWEVNPRQNSIQIKREQGIAVFNQIRLASLQNGHTSERN